MARMGSFDFSELKELQRQLNRLRGDAATNAFCEACARELAARLLAKVIKRTPVGDYSKEVDVTAKRDGKHHKKGDTYTKKISTKKGGTLRRGWTAQREGSGAEGFNARGVKDFVDTLKVHHYGDTYVIELVNPVEYASYVEYGHRTSNHKRWVKGQFMMTISEREIERIAPALLEKRLKEFLGGAFK